MTEEEAKEAMQKLELVMADVNRQYGNGSVFRYGTDNIAPWPALPTGALTLDDALGIGGLPKGRIVEVFGPESSGKSTLCMSVVAAAQKAGGIAAYIDAEHAVDPAYASNLGVDMDELILCQPDYGEMALEVMIRLVRSGVVSVVIVDSVAALTPKAEIEGEMTDQQMGLLARMMSKSMRSLMSAASESQTLVIFTNQIREKIGVMFGNPEVTPGGRGLRFASSVRIDLRKREDLKDSSGNIVGVTTKAKVIKNKMAPPFKIAEFDIMYGRGINEMGCIVDLAVTKGVLTKSGSWLKYNGESFAQGRQKAVEVLASDLVLADKIKGEALAS
jgi:recombination protein RecA